MKIGLVVPHIFMQDAILPHVIFSPGQQAIAFAEALQNDGQDVTLYTPGPVTLGARNTHTDLSYFEQELTSRGYGYIELLKKHPLTFISLARQAQSELIAKVFADANDDALDIVHIYTNEEDIALPFVQFCRKPVVFTHHDPYNFSTQYRTVFPKYKHLNWLSLSYSQRSDMPADTNWTANIYHGLHTETYRPNVEPSGRYIAYLGRIIESKGVHLAISAVRTYNQSVPRSEQLQLRIAGKHYASHAKDTYWHTRILPEIDNQTVFYDGFIKSHSEKEVFLGNSQALIIPSTFSEPFGMVMIEALACGTPIIGLASGAIPEVIQDGTTGYIVQPSYLGAETGEKQKIDESKTAANLSAAIGRIDQIDRSACRADFDKRFTLDNMSRQHIAAYRKLLGGQITK
jgi:glycosyltransferase involved in cell wall biosynthesis